MPTVTPTPRMRVVFVGHSAAPGGAELSLLALLPHLDVDRHVILGAEGPLVERFRATASTEVLPLQGHAKTLTITTGTGLRGAGPALLSLTTQALPLATRLRELRPDLVHANTLRAGIYGCLAARLAGIPVVWHLRDRISPDYLDASTARAVLHALRLLPHHVIANSRSTAAFVPPGRPVTIIPSPLSSASQPTSRRHRGPTLFGLASRLAPWKGQEDFLRAFAAAFPGGDQRAIILGSPQFGDDTFARHLANVTHELGLQERVALTGHRADVLHELAAVDVLVHCPRIPEPFGRIIIEGLASGATVLARGDGGPAEIITSGYDGLLYDPVRPGALVDAMRLLDADAPLRLRLADAGRTTARTYAPEPLAAQVMQVYQQVLGRA